jgi:hypothetical protein
MQKIIILVLLLLSCSHHPIAVETIATPNATGWWLATGRDALWMYQIFIEIYQPIEAMEIFGTGRIWLAGQQYEIDVVGVSLYPKANSRIILWLMSGSDTTKFIGQLYDNDKSKFGYNYLIGEYYNSNGTSGHLQFNRQPYTSEQRAMLNSSQQEELQRLLKLHPDVPIIDEQYLIKAFDEATATNDLLEQDKQSTFLTKDSKDWEGLRQYFKNKQIAMMNHLMIESMLGYNVDDGDVLDTTIEVEQDVDKRSLPAKVGLEQAKAFAKSINQQCGDAGAGRLKTEIDVE